jgi:hypothetical protein
MNRLTSLIIDNTNPGSISSRLRARRSSYIRRLVEQAIAERGHCSIVDLGGTTNFWLQLDWFSDVRNCVKITLVNTLDVETAPVLPFLSIHADATDPKLLQGRCFDICHSNSVIEHVGSWQQKKAFASNVIRLGTAYVVQTPNYCFPIEPHLFFPIIHWLPKPVQISLLTRFTLGWSRRPNTPEEAIERLENIDLLTLKEFRLLFPEAEIRLERLAGMVKSFIAVRKFRP